MTTSKAKKGGLYRYVMGYVVDNDVVTIPAGFAIDHVIIQKIGTTAGNFALGTTDDGVDVVNTVAMGKVDGAFIDTTLLLKVFSTTANTDLSVTAATAAATFNLYVLMHKIN